MHRLSGIRTRYLVGTVVLADAVLFAGALPFLLLCKASVRGAAPELLAAMLLANLLFLVLTLAAAAASAELMRRGFLCSLGALTRLVHRRAAVPVRVRSRRSGY